jgi:mRNA-degrading endonuclease toxin of MazEF toxin-antitoxin module
VLPIDPTADRSRRAWLACPCCDHGAKCGDCRDRRNCDTHWQYLLSNKGHITRVLAEQTAAADPSRLGKSVGYLRLDEMRRVDAALRIVLDL